MVSDFVLNGNDCTMTDGTTPRSIKTVSVAAYAMDDHIHNMVAYNDGSGMAVWAAGGYYVVATGGTDKRVPVKMEVLVPPASFAKGAGFITAVGV